MADVRLNTTLVILAGGEGARMGKPKGLLTIAGRPILKHILHNAQWPGPTLLVTSPGRQSPPGFEAFSAEATDPVAGLGPMRGVLTALEHATTEQIIVSPVDMPSLGAEMFLWLAESLQKKPHALAVLTERFDAGKSIVEPLPAAFRRDARNLLERRLASGNDSLRALIECENILLLPAPSDFSPDLWTNLNYPDDLARWDRL